MYVTPSQQGLQMKETLYTRHQNTVEPMMVKRIGKLHSKLLTNKVVKSHDRNVVLDGRPPSITSNLGKDLTRKEHSTKIRILWTSGLLQEQMQAATSVQTAP